jgi:hypothetical protein
MTMTMAPICVACKHFQGWSKTGFGGTCSAYPDGIPNAILMNEANHTRAIAGDQGIHFAPRTKQDAGYPAIVFSGPKGSAPPISQTIAAPAQTAAQTAAKSAEKE